MYNFFHPVIVSGACIAGLFTTLPALAQDARTTMIHTTQVSQRSANTGTSFAVEASISAEHLNDFRGGTDTSVSNMKLSGTVASNTARDMVTGANSISAGSFANAIGIPIVIQNSGANVLIQNATIINLQMH